MTRVAAIDCGTNSIRLLVADVDPASGHLVDGTRRMEIVRLGQGVDATGTLSEQAMARTLAACDSYAADIRRLGAVSVRFCATSAVRDANNAATFAAGVRERLGVDVEVLDGAEEARLSYDGATRELRHLDLPTPMLVFDIGGGSTEFVLGDGGEPTESESVDMGSVRVTERHLLSDPPTQAQVAAAQADVDAMLSRLRLPLANVRTLVGVAGTVTTVAARVLRLDRYDSERIHLSRLAVRDVHSAARELLAMSVAQRRALPYMHPGRADVIGGGALIFTRVAELIAPSLVRPEVVVSEHDILDGIAWSLV